MLIIYVNIKIHIFIKIDFLFLVPTKEIVGFISQMIFCI